jgi:pyridoxal-phosphate dependent enzyme
VPRLLRVQMWKVNEIWDSTADSRCEPDSVEVGQTVVLSAGLIPLAAIHEARRVIAGTAIRTPLVRLNLLDTPAEIYLKLENLQPIGSFKIRGATNAIARLSPEQLERGVVTA